MIFIVHKHAQSKIENIMGTVFTIGSSFIGLTKDYIIDAEFVM